MADTLDIKAKAPYPAGSLSNFAPHVFAIDAVRCASMEGFLQSLKIEDLTEQERVCGLPGPVAQSVGRKHNWSTTGTLWWRGRPYDRLSPVAANPSNQAQPPATPCNAGNAHPIEATCVI